MRAFLYTVMGDIKIYVILAVVLIIIIYFMGGAGATKADYPKKMAIPDEATHIMFSLPLKALPRIQFNDAIMDSFTNDEYMVYTASIKKGNKYTLTITTDNFDIAGTTIGVFGDSSSGLASVKLTPNNKYEYNILLE